MAPVNTPRPTPKFFLEEKTFSTKKEKGTPRDNPPPRPPGKSGPPISRVFPHRQSTRAQIVSFKESDTSFFDKNYDINSHLPYFDQCFEVICKLGSGSFADVYKVRSKLDGKYYAIKRSKEKFKGKFDRQRKLDEVKKHEDLPKHGNCICFIKAWEEKQYLYLQTELCKNSLSQYAEENHDIPEHLIWNYLVDLLLALKHLHDHNLVHLDIKPDNIFLSEDGICKLGDFGLVLDLSKEDISDATEGDPKYLAAELMEGKFTKAADVYSLGITILELACDLILPTGGALWHRLRKGDIPSEFLKQLSPELSEVICWMMTPDHTRRPTVNEILQMTSVSKVLKKRKFSLMIKSTASYFMLLYRYFLFCLCCIRDVTIYPFTHFSSKEKAVTPVHDAKLHPMEWDLSFSDDEVFGDEPKSLANSFSDSSGESRNNSFTCPSIPDRLACSTPAAMRYWPGRNDGDRAGSPSFRLQRTSPHVSMNGSPGFRGESPVSSIKKNGQRPVGNLSIIGPRNLMAVFDAESDND